MQHVCQMPTEMAGSSRDLLDCECGRVKDQGCSRWRETAREPVGLDPDLAMVDRMKEEERRLMTYANWPSSSQDPAKLAEVGLFYTGRLDRVKCAFCLGVLKEWQPGDIPLAEHRRHFPYCRFIRGEDVGNIPVRQPAIHRVPATSGLGPATHDASDGSKGSCTSVMNENMYISPRYITPPSNYRSRPSDAEACTKPSSSTQMNHSTDKTPVPSVGPADRILDYTSEACRLATFKHWPVGSQILPEDLARAGFYHAPIAGKPDRVRCGYCQGRLYGWSGEEDPEMEHRKCFPTCPLVRMTGGEARTPNHSLTSPRVPSFCEGNRATSIPGRLDLSSKNAQTTASRDMATTNDAEFRERMCGDEGLLPNQNMEDIGAFMLKGIVKQVMEMGFARETIERVVASRSSSGEMSTVHELVEALLNYDV